jgi:soluble lytic murein transglycosylase
MGHYGPSGEKLDPMMRYPYPNWTPIGGWRIDPSLVYAHSLQESAFRTSVISGAGARGLMQVKANNRTGNGARARLFPVGQRSRPAFGQSRIWPELYRESCAT